MTDTPTGQPAEVVQPRVRLQPVPLPSPEALTVMLRDSENLRAEQLTRIAAEMDRIVGYVQAALPSLSRDQLAVSRVAAEEVGRLRELVRSYLR